MVTVGHGAGQPAGRIPARTILLLGVDPGQHGAAALIEWPSRRLLMRWSWTPVAAGLRVRVGDGPPRARMEDTLRVEDSMHDAAGAMRLDVLDGVPGAVVDPRRVVVSVEGLFAHAGPAMTLAEWAGETMGPLRCLTDEPIRRPMAREWRPRILGISARTTAARAEAAAIRWATAAGYLEGMDGATKAERGAVAEACAIALWGAL